MTLLRLKKIGEIWSSNPCVLQARLRGAGYTLGFATHLVSLELQSQRRANSAIVVDVCRTGAIFLSYLGEPPQFLEGIISKSSIFF